MWMCSIILLRIHRGSLFSCVLLVEPLTERLSSRCLPDIKKDYSSSARQATVWSLNGSAVLIACNLICMSGIWALRVAGPSPAQRKLLRPTKKVEFIRWNPSSLMEIKMDAMPLMSVIYLISCSDLLCRLFLSLNSETLIRYLLWILSYAWPACYQCTYIPEHPWSRPLGLN